LALLFAGAAQGASAFSIEHRGIDFDLYRLDKGEEQRLEFFWKRPDGTPYGSIHALRSDLEAHGRKLVFAVNGGIFSEQFTPLGLYIQNGRRIYRLNLGDGGGNFFLKPNGVFYVTAAGARVVRSEDYRPEEGVRNAVQSGPVLVSKGELHPRFIPGYHSKNVRHGVGVDREGRVVFAISDDPVNFHDFGTLFRDALDCPNALYLDGSISEMYAPALNRFGGWPWQQFTTLIGIAESGPASSSTRSSSANSAPAP
jgi:uncharacterized protein YigE (DUF2233 family)